MHRLPRRATGRPTCSVLGQWGAMREDARESSTRRPSITIYIQFAIFRQRAIRNSAREACVCERFVRVWCVCRKYRHVSHRVKADDGITSDIVLARSEMKCAIRSSGVYLLDRYIFHWARGARREPAVSRRARSPRFAWRSDRARVSSPMLFMSFVRVAGSAYWAWFRFWPDWSCREESEWTWRENVSQFVEQLYTEKWVEVIFMRRGEEGKQNFFLRTYRSLSKFQFAIALRFKLAAIIANEIKGDVNRTILHQRGFIAVTLSQRGHGPCRTGIRIVPPSLLLVSMIYPSGWRKAMPRRGCFSRDYCWSFHRLHVSAVRGDRRVR